jgi:hypothetical protein
MIERVIESMPFLMQARAVRASILGLLGKDQAGLDSIPDESAPKTLAEWRRQYFRGVLLLKLDRFKEARKKLVENAESMLLTGDEKNVSLLAAAFACLLNEDRQQADDLMNQIGVIHDTYIKQLRMVVMCHVLAAKGEKAQFDRLVAEIDANRIDNHYLQRAVTELKRGRLEIAQQYEIKAFLTMSA